MRLPRIAFGLLALSLADCLLTLWLLSLGGQEVNPIMKYFLGLGWWSFVTYKMATTFIAIVLAVRYAPRTLVWGCFILGVADLWNLSMLLLLFLS